MRNAIVRKVVATSFATALIFGGGATLAQTATASPTTATVAEKVHHPRNWEAREYNRGFRDGFRDGFRAGCSHHKGLNSLRHGGWQSAYSKGYERGFDRGFQLGEHRCHVWK
jgi:flagellar biosynthesis/type III secretory pathway protein FliH